MSKIDITHKQQDYETIKDAQNDKDLFVLEGDDKESLWREYGRKFKTIKEYDGFLVHVIGGDYIRIYGFSGGIPELHKTLTRLKTPSEIINEMVATKNKHYHVLAGFSGCMPETNNSHKTLTSAREDLKNMVRDLRDGKNTLSGSLKSGHFDLLKKTDALCDYLEITTCHEQDCMNDLEE